jgi:nucleoside-diphosphate-sugar epimerase
VKILVTGISGYIGAAIAPRPVEEGHEVRGLFYTGLTDNVAHEDGAVLLGVQMHSLQESLHMPSRRWDSRP